MSPPIEDDFWSRLETNNSNTNLKRDKTTPPPVPASLFGGGGKGNERGNKVGNEGGSDGWGDWGNDDDIQIETIESSTDKSKVNHYTYIYAYILHV